MSNKKLIVLTIVAVLMVIWAVTQSRLSNAGSNQSDGPTYLVQGLDPADIEGISLLGPAGKWVNMKRQRNHFVLSDKDDYQADTSSVNELIGACLDIKTGELYTDDKTNHKDLGVDVEDATMVVKFLRADSSVLAGVVVGRPREQAQGGFVRLISSDKVYVAIEQIWMSDDAIGYIDTQLISVDAGDIESLTVSGLDSYTLKADESSKAIILENLPPGKKLNQSDAKDVFAAYAKLKFDDVKKQSAMKEAINFDGLVVCRLKDSSIYVIQIAQVDDKIYLLCEADFMDKAPITNQEIQDANDAELKAKEAKLLTRDKIKQFTAKHKGWVYEIDTKKAPNLLKQLSDLLEDTEIPAEQPQQQQQSQYGPIIEQQL